MTAERTGLHARIKDAAPEVEQRVREALTAEGFGVITEIDMQAVLADRIGEQIGPYKLLGACNPQLAFRAISASPGFGVHLPCTVALYEREGETHVEIANPLDFPGVEEQPLLTELAADVHARMQRVIKAVE